MSVNIVDKNLGNTIKERVEFKPPWTTVEFPKDDYGFNNIGHIFNVEIPKQINSVTFIDSRNVFSEVDPSFVKVPKDFEGIMSFVLSDLGVEVPSELSDKTKIWKPEKRALIEAMTAATVYNSDGSEKDPDDNEAPALLFIALACRDTDPQIAEKCFDELLDRRKYLPAINKKADIDYSELKLGEIPIEKIYTTHVTNFLPIIDGERVIILPRVDTDGVPRTTIHTFINGMVEDHGTGGLNVNSWKKQKYMIGMKFEDDIKENGLPENFFKADTFWSLEPGIGMTIPKGSFLIVPHDEIDSMEPYKKLGIEIVGYNSNEESLNEASEKLFKEKQIPLIKNVHPDPEQYDTEDYRLAEKLGVPAVNHFNHRKTNDSEDLMMWSQKVIQEGENFSKDGEGKIHRDEAHKISLRSKHQIWTEWKQKKTGLAMALNYTRDTIIEEWHKNNLPKEYLIAAYISNLI